MEKPRLLDNVKDLILYTEPVEKDYKCVSCGEFLELHYYSCPKCGSFRIERTEWLTEENE